MRTASKAWNRWKAGSDPGAGGSGATIGASASASAASTGRASSGASASATLWYGRPCGLGAATQHQPSGAFGRLDHGVHRAGRVRSFDEHDRFEPAGDSPTRADCAATSAGGIETDGGRAVQRSDPHD